MPRSIDSDAPRRPTIDDVAARAGVSSAAVSFAMNGRPRGGGGHAAADPRRGRGAGLAARARRARALSSRGRGPSGCCSRGRSSQLEVDPFFVRFLAGHRAVAGAHRPCAGAAGERRDGPADLGAYERLAASGRVDGFLLCDVELDDPRFDLLAEAGLPAVVAGHPVSPCPFPWLETEHDARHGRGGGRAPRSRSGTERIGFLRRRASATSTSRRAWRVARRAGRRGARARPVAFGGPGGAARRDVHGARAHQRRARRRRARRGARRGPVGARRPLDHGLRRLAAGRARRRRRSPAVRIDYAQFGEAAAAALLAAIAGEPATAVRRRCAAAVSGPRAARRRYSSASGL